MRVTQGTFAFLPDFTDEEIEQQIKFAIRKGWIPQIEYTDDPHPRNGLWEMHRQPFVQLEDEDQSEEVMESIRECREQFPNHYVKITIYDRTLGRQTTAFDFIIQRPDDEPGFAVERQHSNDRTIRYTHRPYSADDPPDRRYQRDWGPVPGGGAGSEDGSQS